MQNDLPLLYDGDDHFLGLCDTKTHACFQWKSLFLGCEAQLSLSGLQRQTASVLKPQKLAGFRSLFSGRTGKKINPVRSITSTLFLSMLPSRADMQANRQQCLGVYVGCLLGS